MYIVLYTVKSLYICICAHIPTYTVPIHKNHHPKTNMDQNNQLKFTYRQAMRKMKDVLVLTVNYRHIHIHKENMQSVDFCFSQLTLFFQYLQISITKKN